jgi:YVTN family beta-propeller protein
LALDAAGTRLFVSNMASTRLTVVNAADLSEIRTVDVGRGARNLLWDEATHTLVIGLYFDGDLLVLGGDDLREVGRLHVGRRIRSLAPYGPGSIIVTSAGGAFVVRLDEAFALPKD